MALKRLLDPQLRKELKAQSQFKVIDMKTKDDSFINEKSVKIKSNQITDLSMELSAS